MDWGSFLVGIVPTILTGSILFYWQRKQKKHDETVEEHANARRCESLLLLDMQLATAKLSYACAMAIKRGKPNGEIEEGVNAYEAAKEKYNIFLIDQTKKHLMED